MRHKGLRGGFTLIEILIVVSIIAILASLILAGVSFARNRANLAVATTTVGNWVTALKAYQQDTGGFPGAEYKDEVNAFPALFEALIGDKKKGKGGPGAPYMEIKEKDVVVLDDEQLDSEGNPTYRAVEDPADIYENPKLEKYIIDPWGRPYVYHENRSRPRQKWMHGRDFDIYSTGANKTDDTIEGLTGSDNDDIGSW
ncbi:MAG: prepilin-type N-terminal cleavage/methylation domain-containing protein [Thermoanaerobaculia bacterium]